MENDTIANFDTYPVRGPVVMGFIDLLASIAARSIEEQTAEQQKGSSDGHK